MPLILGANSVTGGYEVDNSLRFNSGSSDNLSRTFGTPTSGTTWTINFWVKKSSNGSALNLCSRLVDGSNEDRIRFTSGDALEWSVYKSGSYAGRLVTNRLFRDNSAFYNIVCVWDTTNGTAGDRMRMYVNGVEETSFSTDTNPSLNETSLFNASGSNHRIGSVTSGEYFNGYMSEVILIDGTALDSTSFGEFDSATGIWKPIAYTGTYGTNGFYLEFKDSSALGDDTSGEGNNFTVNNLTSIDQTTDTPTNNFCTMNPLFSSNMTYSEGNTKVTATTFDVSSVATLGVSQGKWYFEIKILDQGGRNYLGITDGADKGLAQGNIRSSPANYVYFQGFNGAVVTSGTDNGNLTTAVDNDILCVALDLDNGQCFMSLNSNIDIGVTAIATSLTTGNYFQAFYNETSSGADISINSFNFGNPSFTISTGNADANGYGNFEYAVPSGFYALNTKNLAEYG